MSLTCETCHLPLKCEACGIAEADTASNYINNELQMVAIRLCHRCNFIGSVAESDRTVADARAIFFHAMTERNMDAYLDRERRRAPVTSTKNSIDHAR